MAKDPTKEELAQKILLEKSLKIKMRKFFKQLNSDVGIIWSNSGALPDFEFYESDLSAILREHYRRVGNIFSEKIRNDIFNKYHLEDLELKQSIADELSVEDIEEEESRIEAAVLAALLGYIALHSVEQARFILNTTNGEYNKLLDKIISNSAEQGLTLTREQVSQELQTGFDEKIEGRVDSISLTETQNMAERSKLTEALVLIGSALLVGGALVGETILKTWHAILDDRVRDHHADASGQTVMVTDAFIVKGEQLMHPGDTSLGASADNVINCRCGTSFSVI